MLSQFDPSNGERRISTMSKCVKMLRKIARAEESYILHYIYIYKIRFFVKHGLRNIVFISNEIREKDHANTEYKINLMVIALVAFCQGLLGITDLFYVLIQSDKYELTQSELSYMRHLISIPWYPFYNDMTGLSNHYGGCARTFFHFFRTGGNHTCSYLAC
jgi:hypothetical protein